MFKNYLKIAFRNFFRNKLNSFINLVGLSLGLAACILITMYVSHEKSYDKFHEDSNKIYTTAGEFKVGDEKIRMSRMSHVVAGQLKENDLNIDEVLRYYQHNQAMRIATILPKSQPISEDKIAAVDANFFTFFSFNLLYGNAESVLNQPFSIVLTKTVSEKYFGLQNPIGKQLSLKQDKAYIFTVTGIMEDFPSNSSITSDFLISMKSLSAMEETKELMSTDYFQGGSFTTYLKLKDINKANEVEATAMRLDRLANEEADTTFVLDKFTDTHALSANTGRFNYLSVFPIVALLILILALTNYMSLTTARAGARAKEVGVRKISGAGRKSIAFQFYIESAIFVCISFIVGILISIMFKDFFLELLNINVDNSFYFNEMFIMALIGVFLFAVVTSGIYPALILSSLNPIKNFKNKLTKHTGGVLVRKVFTTFQFAIAVLLIVCGIVMSAQLDFIRNKDTGLIRSNIVMIPVETSMMTNATAFRNEVKKLPEVEQTTLAMNQIYGGYNAYFVSKENSQESYSVSTFNVDEHFMETLGVTWYLKPEERTAFSENSKVIINKKTIESLGLRPDPRGDQMDFGNRTFEIAGVVNDFNYASLENPIKPLAFFVSSETNANENILGVYNSYLYVKLTDKIEISSLLNKLGIIYKEFDETASFTYQFMDDAFDTLYKAEERLSYIFNVFIVLALIIAGLGLLGLVTFMAEKRMKEIGIRKVLGASISEIVILLSTDFIRLVLLAIVVAIPLGWYLSDSWLSYFVFKINVPWWSFAIAGAIAILLSVLTLSIQGLRAATSNPINSLRSE